MHTSHLYKINKCEKQYYILFIDIYLLQKKKGSQTINSKSSIVVFLEGP